mgnify:CR=1 FL=1
MLNSEKMVASIQKQDLEHADKYFKRALKEDDAETLLELAEYLEALASCHKQGKFICRNVRVILK